MTSELARSESAFRGLFNQEGQTTFLYLSWYVKFAPSIDPSYTSALRRLHANAGGNGWHNPAI